MNSEPSILGVVWLLLGIAVAGLGWRRSNGILTAVGVLMLGVVAWNVAASLWARPL
jgi:hypothetical protein